MSEDPNVVVIGGYAGVMAANRLTQRDDLTVTLINPRPTFVVDYRVVLAGLRNLEDRVTL